MRRNHALATVAFLILVACDAPKTLAVDEHYLGSALEPPAGLAALRVGMTTDQARAAVPGLALAPDGSALVIASGHPTVTISAPLDPAGEVDRIEMTMAMPATDTSTAAIAQMTDKLTRAWGPPIAKDFFDMPIWASADTGWRVTTHCWSGHASVTFFAHRPVPAGVFGDSPRLPGLLAQLNRGAGGDATVRLGANADVGRHLGGDGLRYKIVLDHAPFARIDLTLPAAARATVRAAWAGGVEAKDANGHETVVWFDPARRWRMTLELDNPVVATLTFERYLPVDALIGVGPADAIPLLQMVPDELDPPFFRFWLPPTEWERERTTAYATERDGVEQINVIVSYRDDRERDELLALFARRWQPPAASRTRTGGPAWVFHRARPRVVVTDTGTGALDLAIAPDGDELTR